MPTEYGADRLPPLNALDELPRPLPPPDRRGDSLPCFASSSSDLSRSEEAIARNKCCLTCPANVVVSTKPKGNRA